MTDLDALKKEADYILGWLRDEPAPYEQEIIDLIQRLLPALEDARRLRWMCDQGEAYGFESIQEGTRWSIDGPFLFLADAIDSAMEKADGK